MEDATLAMVDNQIVINLSTGKIIAQDKLGKVLCTSDFCFANAVASVNESRHYEFKHAISTYVVDSV